MVRPAAALAVATCLCLLGLAGCDGDDVSDAMLELGRPVAPPRADSVRAVMEKVARYQAQANPQPRASWQQSAYFLGAVAAHRATGNARYLRQATRWAEALDWSPGRQVQHADHQAASQVYLALYQIERVPERLAPTRERARRFAESAPRRGRAVWDWVDALFMAPPVLAQLHRLLPEAEGASYAALLDTLYWDAARYHYSGEEHLFYRDDRFFGSDTFWSRGNGWAMASIPRILEQGLPPRHRARYHTLLREMAGALRALQQEDGLWRSDLKHPDRHPAPETSGSAFFTYALAWGLNEGLLAEEAYEPVVQRAWAGLREAVTAEGRLRWVQPPGAGPASASASDTHPYGAGALLLAGSELLRRYGE